MKGKTNPVAKNVNLFNKPATHADKRRKAREKYDGMGSTKEQRDLLARNVSDSSGKVRGDETDTGEGA